MVVPGVSTVTTSTISRQSSILSTGSNDSFVNVETLSPLPLGQSPLTSIPVVKVPVTPSSPQTPSQSPRVTPQHSPKIVMSAPRLQSGAQLQTHNKILVSGTAQLPMSGKLLASGATQLPTTSKLLVSGATQLPTASKLLASSLRQVPIQVKSNTCIIWIGSCSKCYLMITFRKFQCVQFYKQYILSQLKKIKKEIDIITSTSKFWLI